MAWHQFYNGVGVFRKIVTGGSRYIPGNNDWGVIILGEALFDTTPV